MSRIPPRPADTSLAAALVQIDLLRAAPVSRRLHLAWSLSATVISMARRAVARANPRATQAELDVRFVEINHGCELANGLRADLRDRLHTPPPL